MFEKKGEFEFHTWKNIQMAGTHNPIHLVTSYQWCIPITGSIKSSFYCYLNNEISLHLLEIMFIDCEELFSLVTFGTIYDQF